MRLCTWSEDGSECNHCGHCHDLYECHTGVNPLKNQEAISMFKVEKIAITESMNRVRSGQIITKNGVTMLIVTHHADKNLGELVCKLLNDWFSPLQPCDGCEIGAECVEYNQKHPEFDGKLCYGRSDIPIEFGDTAESIERELEIGLDAESKLEAWKESFCIKCHGPIKDHNYSLLGDDMSCPQLEEDYPGFIDNSHQLDYETAQRFLNNREEEIPIDTDIPDMPTIIDEMNDLSISAEKCEVCGNPIGEQNYGGLCTDCHIKEVLSGDPELLVHDDDFLPTNQEQCVNCGSHTNLKPGHNLCSQCFNDLLNLATDCYEAPTNQDYLDHLVEENKDLLGDNITPIDIPLIYPDKIIVGDKAISFEDCFVPKPKKEYIIQPRKSSDGICILDDTKCTSEMECAKCPTAIEATNNNVCLSCGYKKDDCRCGETVHETSHDYYNR